MNTPKISVILPAYNAEKHIQQSIQSILDQTCEDFEFIIINDGSKDSTKEIIQSFSDDRIRYIENEGNKGLIYTLNRGLKLAKGKYIARMDADDISMPTRFEKQVAAFQANSKLIVCGTQISRFGEKTKTVTSNYYITDAGIKKHMLQMCPFAHPSVMMLKSVFDVNAISYDSNYKDAEDYKMWYDLMGYGDFTNLDDVLLLYRISKTQITHSNNKNQQLSASKCRRLIFEKIYSKALPEILSYNYLIDNYNFLVENNLLETFILSLSNYSIPHIFKLLNSRYFFNVDFVTKLRIIKRFFRGPNPLI